MSNTNKAISEEESELLHPDATQYFIFMCDNNYFAIEALQVVEIIEVPHITKVPLLHSFVLGVTNIRGSMVAVLDLRQRVGMRAVDIGKKTTVVIAKTEQRESVHHISFMIDEIYEVDGLVEKEFTQTPIFGTSINPKFIGNIGKYGTKDIAILDLDKVLDLNEISKIVAIDTARSKDKIYSKSRGKKASLYAEESESSDEEDEIDIERLVLSNANDSNQYLLFIGPEGQYFGKNVSKVQEVVSVDEVNLAKNYDESIVSGTANIRGEMLTLLNFDKWLGARPLDDSDYKEIVVLNYGNHRFALLVQETDMIVSIDPKDMYDSSSGNAKSNFITKIEIDAQEKLCTIIDSDSLLRDCFASEALQNESDIANLTKHIESKKTVLFADDSMFIRSLFSKTAKNLGIRHKIYENGKDLLDACEATEVEHIGVIVTDIEMPVVDGKRVIKTLRSQKDFEDIKIIVHTNMANKAMEEDLLSSGADEVISKVDIDSLARSIAKHIR